MAGVQDQFGGCTTLFSLSVAGSQDSDWACLYPPIPSSPPDFSPLIPRESLLSWESSCPECKSFIFLVLAVSLAFSFRLRLPEVYNQNCNLHAICYREREMDREKERHELLSPAITPVSTPIKPLHNHLQTCIWNWRWAEEGNLNIWQMPWLTWKSLLIQTAFDSPHCPHWRAWTCMGKSRHLLRQDVLLLPWASLGSPDMK